MYPVEIDVVQNARVGRRCISTSWIYNAIVELKIALDSVTRHYF